MSIRNRLILFAMAIALCILALVGFWVREHRQHATPETALNHDQHVGGIVAKVPFAKGVVVIAFVQGDSLGAYYMKWFLGMEKLRRKWCSTEPVHSKLQR